MNSPILTLEDIPELLVHAVTSSSFANNLLARWLGSFTSYRADVEVRVTLTGGLNSYGLLMVTVDPNTQNVVTAAPAATGDPEKTFMFASDPMSTTVLMRYKSPYPTPVSSTDHDVWGALVIYAMSPLQNSSSSTVPPVTVTVEARFRNMWVGFPTNAVTFQSKQMLAESKKVAKDGPLATGLKTAGKVVFKTLKTAAGAINPLLPAVLDLLPFNKPIVDNNFQRVILSNADPFCQTNGGSNAIRIGMAPISPAPPICRPDGKDYGLFENYLAIESYVNSTSVLAATSVDTPFLKVPVSPVFGYTYAVSTNSYLAAGPLQFASTFCAKWRGSIKYKVFVCAPTGCCFQLRVALERLNQSTIPSADAGNIVNTLVNVNGSTIFEFVVPFQNKKPYAYIPPNPAAFNWTATSASTSGDRENLMDATSGVLHFTKVTQPSQPYNSTVTPYITVLACAGPDFVLANPVGQGTVTYQSDTQLIAPAEIASEDSFATPEKLVSWYQLFSRYKELTSLQSGGATTVGRYCYPEITRGFQYYRASVRVAFRASADGTVYYKTQWEPSTYSSRVSGPLFKYYSGQDICLELPWIFSAPYMDTTISSARAEEVYYFSAGVPALWASSYADDLQLYFPRFPPVLQYVTTYV